MTALVLLFAALAGVRSLWSPCGLSVAETLLAPARAQRRSLWATFVGGMVVSAVAFGAAVAIVWSELLPALPDGAVATVVVLALGADLVHRLTGRLRPWSVGRQLPLVYGRRFPRRWAALLYGLRLGVAPLTILMTWQWWAAVVVAASAGVGVSMLTGVVFSVVRAAVMAFVVRDAHTGVAAGRTFDAVLAAAPRVWMVSTATAALASAAFAVLAL